MKHYMTLGNVYYSGEPKDPDDFEVPERPSQNHDWINGAWTVSIDAIKAQLSQYAWEVETGGITINGIRIDTSDRSKLLINGMYNLAAQGDPSDTRKFKSKDGEVEITNAQAMAVAVAVGEHVQKRINAEGDVLAEIEAGTITTIEDAITAFNSYMEG